MTDGDRHGTDAAAPGTPHAAVALRPLTLEDVPVLAELERELFGGGAWSAGMLAEELHAPGRWYVGAEHAEPSGAPALVGYAGLWSDGTDATVMTIGVAGGHQGRGVGGALLAALLERARMARAASVLLEVRVDNAPALALYERFGFTRMGRRRGYYQPENVDAWTMRLDLAAAPDVSGPGQRGSRGDRRDGGAGMIGTGTPSGDVDAARGRVLVDADGLRALLDSRTPVTVLDVRWALGRTDGREQHAAGHVPGAVYVGLDAELAAPPSRAAGRHPLPAVDDLQAAARRWGVRAGVPVVAYDAVGGTSAARAWWLLRWAGVPDVRLLDGGLDAWVAAGGRLETGAVTPAPGDVVLSAGALPTLDADAAAALAARADGRLLDARVAERYRGEVEPVDRRAGHIPGAVSAPTGGNLGPDGRFLAAAALRARFAGLGADGLGPVGVYCGSGVTAAHEVAALASIGVDAALYPGSWSQWSGDDARPVAVGPGSCADAPPQRD